ncbi:unnamed protein product, partial [Symbiodinium sp. KB8]
DRPAHLMAMQPDQQLQEAREELALFSALHTRTTATTAPPSDTGTEMDLDRDKRGLELSRMEAPAKFAKGENKGDKQLTAQTGKGQSSTPAPKAGQQEAEETNQKGLPGTGSGSSELARPDRSRRSQGRRDRDSDEDLKDLVKQRGWSLTDNLYRVATEWNRKKEQSPESLTQPLRVVLLRSFLEVLYHKIEAMEEDQDLREKARELGLVQDLGTAPAYPFLLDAKVVVKMLQNLTACPNVIGRFHTLHKLAPQHAAEVIPFSLQIQNRSAESQQMYMGFQRLSRSCATPPSARPA